MQRRLDEYRWHDLRKALVALREETHLSKARFGEVNGINRATVSAVGWVGKKPNYTPSEDVIRRWLDATSREPLHEFMAKYSTEAPKPRPNAEAFLHEYLKPTSSLRKVVTDPVTPAVHNPPLPQPVAGESNASDGSVASDRVYAEIVAVLEQLALNIWTAAGAIGRLREIRPDAQDEHPGRPEDDQMGGPDHDRARRVK